MKKLKNLNKKQKIISGVAIAVIAFGGYTGYGTYKNYKLDKEMKSIVDIYQIPGREKIFMNGKVFPLKSEDFFINEEQGQLDTIKVDDNQYVEKGAPLFTCKNNIKLNEIADLNYQITIKKKEIQNALDEESKTAISTEIKSLNDQIIKLNKTAYSTIYAPYSGKVYITKNSQDNTKPILKLQTTDFYVKAQINERDSYKIALNQSVELTALASKLKYNGEISRIDDIPVEGEEMMQNSSSDTGMTQYGIEVKLNNQENLKTGLNVQIVALAGSNDKNIPNTAIEKEGNKSYVYKVQDNIAYRTEIKVVEEKNEFTLVSRGVSENDEIIKDIQGKEIKDGEKVNTGEENK